jgi:hypothetical protein
MILADAIKCRYCGEIFDEDLRRAERRERRGTAASDQNMSVGEWILAIILTDIACIIAIVWMIQGKPKGSKMFAVSLIIEVIKVAIFIAISSAAKR